MPITNGSLGPIGRVGLKEAIYIAAESVPDQSLMIVGQEYHTTQLFEQFMTLGAFGNARIVNNGNNLDEDQPEVVAVGKYTPLVVGLQWSYGTQIEYVDQYRKILGLAPMVALSFAHTRNFAAAQMNISGFTTGTAYGPVSTDSLYSTAHPASVGTGSNRPSPDIGFSPLGIQQARNEIRAQKDTRGKPLLLTGNIVVTAPINMWQYEDVIESTMYLPGTNNNDVNVARSGVSLHVCDYYPVPSNAWYVRAADDRLHGLFCLNQMPFEIEQLVRQPNLQKPWLAWESYVFGYNRWQGTWGTSGAA